MITEPATELTLLKLQALLEAGLPLDIANRLIGVDLEGLETPLRQRLDTLCQIAERFGGSIAAGLDALLVSQRHSAQLRNDIAFASRLPKLTSRLILCMPIAAVAITQLLGLNVVGLALHNPVIAASMVVGLALMKANQKFADKKLRAINAEISSLFGAQDSFGEALAIISAGATIDAARATLAKSSPHAELLELLELADEYGLAASAFIKSASVISHTQAVNEIKRKVATLQTRLIAPLALLSVPVLTFLAIIPVVMTLITN